MEPQRKKRLLNFATKMEPQRKKAVVEFCNEKMGATKFKIN
jgi:hypothetical protein